MSSGNELCWQLLYTKSRAEEWVEINLRKQGFATLLPRVRSRSGFGPLFPRYLFAGVDISGTKWELDYSANRKAYADAATLPKGDDAKSVAELLTAGGGKAPEIFRPFLESLEKNIGAGTVH